MGNMPVIKDLIVDMDAVHWKKMQRVTPWLLPDGDPPGARVHRAAESMIDVTQTMACIQCGACVSDCLSMEVDPLFIGPAALGQGLPLRRRPARRPARAAPEGPRRGPARHLRLHALLQLHRGVPEGRRADEPDHAPAADRGADHGSTTATTATARDGVRQEHRENGLLHEADLLPDSYGGKFHPRAVPELLDSLPTIVKGLQRRKVTPRKALMHEHKAPEDVKRIFAHVHDKSDRYELNLYVVGYEDEDEAAGTPEHADAAGSHLPEERSPNQ
jgi:succinate dehydrogenase / fumarate reductase iron-sulfur subunit